MTVKLSIKDDEFIQQITILRSFATSVGKSFGSNGKNICRSSHLETKTIMKNELHDSINHQ